MNDQQKFWQRLSAFILLRTPLLSYGELVLRPVTIAERAALDRLSRDPGQNKK